MKKILIITYKFPPVTGPRSIRWVQFSKYLSGIGHKIEILTIQPQQGFGTYDPSSLNDLPSDIVIHRTYPGPLHSMTYRYLPMKQGVVKNKTPSEIRTSMRGMIRNFYKSILEPILIPDKMVEWLPWALPKLNKLKSNRYDLVISSAMPFSAHILGRHFKKITGIPWIADYGDPWSFNPFVQPWRSKIDREIEKSLLKAVDAVLVTTEETKNGFIKYYPFLNPNNIYVIPQSFNKNSYETFPAERGSHFLRIVYTGIFYEGMREPFNFFEAIQRLSKLDIEVIIAGETQSRYVQWVREKGLQDKVHFLGHQSHDRVVALQKGADLLLLLGSSGGYQLPGKIFEYLGARRPILSVKYEENDISAKLVEKHMRGFVVADDPKEICEKIRQAYQLKQDGKLDDHFSLMSLNEYTWQNQGARLDQLIAALQ